ncbi:hypothetical protein E4T49_00140 [Aureobasidium sp. EXF-10728]|nr:hypothetical protein E4T49_00140 [Aureobasidium sp. EXF-10728]
MTIEDTKEWGSRSLYDNSTLSDVTIKFSDHQVYAHKAILAHKSDYFMTAFTSRFQKLTLEMMTIPKPFMQCFATSTTCRTPKVLELTSGSEENLVLCLNVFIVADKYDVISLRQKVIPNFRQTETFVESVKKLCGPDAIHLADPSLQTAVVDFLIADISKITHHSSLVKIIEEDKSFTGRVLAGLLKPTSGSIRYLPVCHKPNHSAKSGPGCAGRAKGQSGYLEALGVHCVHCGTARGTAYNMAGRGSAGTHLVNTIKVVLI